jgi:murein DD-endopeptidase MepM/ murein hydrolase activator NlpD
MWLALPFAALAAAQGDVLTLRLPDEPGLAAVSVVWDGVERPFARRDDAWITLIGVDLDTDPGPHAAPMRLRFEDGHERPIEETIVVGTKQFPTTTLTVAPGYVDLSPADQARAARESSTTAAIYATLTPEMLWSEPFVVPIAGASGGRNFGHRRVFNGEPRAPHSGADLRASTGTPVRAANRGRVVLAQDLFFSGNAVFVDHGLGLYSVYLHLSRIDVRQGDLIERGQTIGLSGATGRVTGPHLHWGIRVLDARVDPFTLPLVTEE